MAWIAQQDSGTDKFHSHIGQEEVPQAGSQVEDCQGMSQKEDHPEQRLPLLRRASKQAMKAIKARQISL